MTEKKSLENDIKDLSKKGVKNIADFEELIQRSIDNGALNKHEGREIFKRLSAEKKEISLETKNKLLEVAQKGNWVSLVRKLQEISKDSSAGEKSGETAQVETPLKTQKTQEKPAENQAEKIEETHQTKEIKSHIEFMLGDYKAQKEEITLSKKWDSLSFWNKEEKNIQKEIFENIIGVLQKILNQESISYAQFKAALMTELSTSEGGTRYKEIREKIKNDMVSRYFGEESFLSNAKQNAVISIRQNLAGNELENIFQSEIGKPYTPGMEVPDDKKWLVSEYEKAFDPKNEWGTISDDSANTAKGVLAYDVTSMAASGLGTGLLIKGGTTLAMKSAKIASVGDKINNAGKTTKVLNVTMLAGIEGTTFTALHEGIRKQEWFLNQDDVTKKIVFNSLMFSTFRLVDAFPLSFFKGLEKNTSLHQLIDGLYNQGLVAPAIYISAMMGYEQFTSSEKKTLEEWLKEFIMVGIVGGTFHLTGVGVTKTIEGLSTNAKINTKKQEIVFQTEKGTDVVIPMTKEEIQKITPTKVETMLSSGVEFSSAQLKNLQAHGVIVNNGKLELDGFGNMYGHILGNKTLTNFISFEIKNPAKNILNIKLTDTQGKVFTLQTVKEKGKLKRVSISDSQGKMQTFDIEKEQKIIGESFAKQEVILPEEKMISSITKKQKEKITVPEQKIISKTHKAQMKNFGVRIEGDSIFLGSPALTQAIGDIRISNYQKISLSEVSENKITIEFIEKNTHQKSMAHIYKTQNNHLRVDVENLGPMKVSKSFEMETPGLSKVPSSFGETLPPKKTLIQALEVSYADMKNIPKSKSIVPEKKLEGKTSILGENYLVDFFSGDQIQKTFSQGLNPRLMLRNGGKGNIQIELTRSGEIKSGNILMHGKNMRFTITNGDFRIALDEIKNPNINFNAITKLVDTFTKQ